MPRRTSTTEWPEHLVVRLRDLVAASKSAGAISRELHVTRNAVIGKCARLGLSLSGDSFAHQQGKRRKRHAAMPVERREWVEPSPPRRFSWEAEA